MYGVYIEKKPNNKKQFFRVYHPAESIAIEAFVMKCNFWENI